MTRRWKIRWKNMHLGSPKMGTTVANDEHEQTLCTTHDQFIHRTAEVIGATGKLFIANISMFFDPQEDVISYR